MKLPCGSYQAQFCIANTKHITLNQRASYSEISASLWLAVRIQVYILTRTVAQKLPPSLGTYSICVHATLQMLAAFVVFFISIMAIVGKGNSHMSTATAGLVWFIHSLPFRGLFVGLHVLSLRFMLREQTWIVVSKKWHSFAGWTWPLLCGTYHHNLKRATVLVHRDRKGDDFH